MTNDYLNLSKTISLILRHNLDEYNLKMDDYGWVSLSDLIFALNSNGLNSTINDIHLMINNSYKKRHQIKDNKIRAFYGHSLDKKIIKDVCTPPLFLYHGTVDSNWESIRNEGLKKMSRQFVHLSADKETAKKVGYRKKGNLLIIKIKSKEAFENDIKFYKEENGVWLCDELPSKYLLL